MFGDRRKIVARIVVVVAVLFAVMVMFGCSQEQATPESREASLKRLAELSGEDKPEEETVETRKESTPPAQAEGNKQQ